MVLANISRLAKAKCEPAHITGDFYSPGSAPGSAAPPSLADEILRRRSFATIPDGGKTTFIEKLLLVWQADPLGGELERGI